MESPGRHVEELELELVGSTSKCKNVKETLPVYYMQNKCNNQKSYVQKANVQVEAFKVTWKAGYCGEHRGDNSVKVGGA